MIEAYIFSRNRAAQLDLLLRSIRDNFKEIHKIYITTEYSVEHKESLEIVKKQDYGLELLFIDKTEETFREVFLGILNNIKTEYVVGFCDDVVAIRGMGISSILNTFTDNILSISLRTSEALTVKYADGLPMKQPDFLSTNPYLIWDWTRAVPRCDWNCPISVCSHVYKTSFYKKIVTAVPFSNPNALESALSRNKEGYGKPLMSSFPLTKVLNISVNKVQEVNKNRAGSSVPVGVDFLLNKFMDGFVIDEAPLYNYKNNCVFVELPFKFKRRSK